MVFVYCFIGIDKAIRWSLAALMCCRQHDRSTVRRHRHCRARLEEPSLPRARSCARRSGTPARSTHRRLQKLVLEILKILKVYSRPKFAQDCESGLRSGRGCSEVCFLKVVVSIFLYKFQIKIRTSPRPEFQTPESLTTY